MDEHAGNSLPLDLPVNIRIQVRQTAFCRLHDQAIDALLQHRLHLFPHLVQPEGDVQRRQLEQLQPPLRDVRRQIRDPLIMLARQAQRIANGDLGQGELQQWIRDSRFNRDELGQLGSAINRMQGSLSDLVSEIAGALRENV